MLIGIDLGTSTCKIIAVDPDGKVVAVASRDYPMINLRPGLGRAGARRVVARDGRGDERPHLAAPATTAARSSASACAARCTA